VKSVAVIDIGSNSIKLLVATRGKNRRLVALLSRTIEARISAGISQAKPRLSEMGMARGVAAVSELLAAAQTLAPRRVILVATSAVRDASNGREFRRRVRAKTGGTIRILTGKEEANLIGRGLTCDPALAGLRNFYVFDLGGGSLECLAFRHRRVVRAVSLPLGCVRLTEKFVPHPNRPFPASAQKQIADHVRTLLSESGFTFSLPAGATAVATGGTVTTVRFVLGARSAPAGADAPRGKRAVGIVPSLEHTPTRVTIAQLRRMLAQTGELPLPGRKKIPGLPPARADVFPAALATLIAVANLGHFPALRHSLYNLRWGLAAQELSR
jgi:exopolyphosphatase / guanosine-5'-triphosphate,3'-diphosphate pyrophosphatase